MARARKPRTTAPSNNPAPGEAKRDITIAEAQFAFDSDIAAQQTWDGPVAANLGPPSLVTPSPDDEDPPRPGRLTRALHACDLERGSVAAPPRPPAGAIARLVRRALRDEGHPWPGIIDFMEAWARKGRRHLACQFIGHYLAAVVANEKNPAGFRDPALAASAALWALQPQEAFDPLPSGLAQDVGPHGVPWSVLQLWGEFLDRAAADRTIDPRARDLARRARAGLLRPGDLPAVLEVLEDKGNEERAAQASTDPHTTTSSKAAPRWR